jgi:alpha-tubulin suppressor-like RCC1 family protein
MTPQLVNMASWVHGMAGVFNACGIQQDNTLHCWGRNAEGQLGVGDWLDRSGAPQVGIDTDWANVAMGRFHTCAQKQDGSVHCTGENVDGQLGLGDTQRRNVFTPVTLP